MNLTLICRHLQSLFPSKEQFDKLHTTIHDVEKQIITLTTLQNKVDDHSRRLDSLTAKIQSLEIQIVKINKPWSFRRTAIIGVWRNKHQQVR